MAFIKAEKLKHKFVRRDEQGEIEDVTLALDDVNIEVEEGQFIAVLGHNGSGKSTFAKHLNALLTPSDSFHLFFHFSSFISGINKWKREGFI